MAIFYPDTSDYQGDISYSGCIAVCSKAGEDTAEDPYFASSKTRAADAGAYLFAYWMLHAGNATGQAQAAHSVVGKIPLMLDVETIGASMPDVADVQEFLAEFLALGGICHLLYMPQWYYNDIGKPSLASLAEYDLFLVSSDYTSYSNSGPGWDGYGGLNVLVWQYSDDIPLNGQNVDFNAFEGDLVDLQAFTSTGAAAGTDPTLSEGATGAAVTQVQTRLNVWGAKLTVDGDFGASTLAAVKAFQSEEKLTADGVVGPLTWTALNKTPTNGAYPPPTALKAYSANLYVTWDAVTVDSKLVPSYTVQVLLGGAVVIQQTSTTANATINGLRFGVEYTVRVWSNGGPVAPSASEFTITL